MESLGINWGYLLVQVIDFLIIAVAISLVVLVIIFLTRDMRRRDRSALIIQVQVDETGVRIPKELLLGAKSVEIRKRAGEIIVLPVNETN